MKLITQNGELDLPKDFSMKLEKHNPILSKEGDAIVPTTLPASSHNLALLDHLERIDRANKPINKKEAILTVGPIQKHGHLLIDTLKMHDGIDASFACDNGDLYTQYKEKTIKEIFKSYNNGDGYVVNVPPVGTPTPNLAFQYLQSVYEGTIITDFMIFPVAVSPYEENKVTVYQINNDIDTHGNLIYGQREVHEGNIVMTVPMGYGISPFIRLYKMIDIMFSILGYTVTDNCFAKLDLKDLCLVNNCADTMVRLVKLDYADLVPSCTLSDFLEWINNKFHAQVFINSEAKTVKVVMMEDILAGKPDLDITNMLEDDFTMQLTPSKRVVITPKVTMDGTEAASDDFDALVKKYGNYYVAVTELEWAGLQVGSPINDHAHDCLVLRRSTGEFYALDRDLNDNYKTKPVYIGSNIMKYDRNNSDDVEEFEQDDLIPELLCSGTAVTPYIGERIHFHTSYNSQEETAKQEIILVRGVINSIPYGYKTSGTTQAYFPNMESTQLTIPFGLMPHDMYDYFWKRYNELIRNHAPHVKGRVALSEARLLNFDMATFKICKQQNLLPISVEANISQRISPADAEFLLIQNYADKATDTPITPIVQSPLKWDLTDDIATALEYYGANIAYDLWEHGVHYYTSYVSGTAEFVDDLGLYWMGVPAAAGETHQITRKIKYTITYRKWVDSSNTLTTETFNNVVGTVIFTAVTNS